MSDVGADVGVGCPDGTVVAAAEAAGTGVVGTAIVGTAIVGTGVRAGAPDAGVSGGCCDARTGAGEPTGTAEVRAGGSVAGELRSIPETPEREL